MHSCCIVQPTGAHRAGLCRTTTSCRLLPTTLVVRGARVYAHTYQTPCRPALSEDCPAAWLRPTLKADLPGKLQAAVRSGQSLAKQLVPYGCRCTSLVRNGMGLAN